LSNSRPNVEEMVAKLPLGADHKLQEHAVAAALHSILSDGRRGVVLADEVGFGKTYEALAVMALLHDHARGTKSEFGHVLVLCKSSLLQKWLEEVSSARANRGFPQYLQGPYWQTHPIHLLDHVRVVKHRLSADELRSGGLRGFRRDGRNQVPAGLYIVNQDLMSEKARATRRPLLTQLWNTQWDLIIVDEAHHYARWNRPARIFAPDGNLRNYNQGIADGNFRHILALTATPFELTPQEMVNLLAIVRADPSELEDIEKGLEVYVKHLDRFFALRQRSPEDPLRAGAVQHLRQLRDVDALGTGSEREGLQELLRRYVIRNTKSQNERRYFLVNKDGNSYRQDQFDKLDDLHECVRRAPLLPFDGPDALFYLELRELIQETVEQAQEGVDRRTFITTDLRQGLSSYPQIAASALLKRNLESAKRIATLLKSWNNPKSKRLHPKVRALVEVVQAIALTEIEKVRSGKGEWFSKVLVFNKLIEGTAPQLREELSHALSPIFEDFLKKLLGQTGLGTTEALQVRIREQARTALESASAQMLDQYGQRCKTPTQFRHEDLQKFVGRPLLDAYREILLRRCQQPLFLLRAVKCEAVSSEEAIAAWVANELVKPVDVALRRIVEQYLSKEAEFTVDENDRLEIAEQEAVFLLEDCRSVDLVGRYDGSNSRDREAHRRNFNDFYNPFVLLVSRVGEEGIDLQKQCRYVIHYDLEWNPAKMEQREGRVDRVGWMERNQSGKTEEQEREFIDVRFMLLKGTYEERIFHTVMLRDQWFQILIGSKRRELGEIKPESEEDPGASSEAEGPQVEDDLERGRLTPEEKTMVMLDLRPRPPNEDRNPTS
jgi:SNF2 family DNA or RNA helicase